VEQADRSGSSDAFSTGALSDGEATAGTDALGRLQRGEIGIEEYLDVQVEAATSHLGPLPPEQLDFVRQTLREQLRSDPVLTELTRRATGTNPADLDR
jgi:hypothetical protein